MNPAGDRYAHAHDDEFRTWAQRAIHQLSAALAVTAIDHYAAEKIDNAAEAVERARVRLAELHPGQQFGGRYVRDGVSLSERRLGEITRDWEEEEDD